MSKSEGLYPSIPNEGQGQYTVQGEYPAQGHYPAHGQYLAQGQFPAQVMTTLPVAPIQYGPNPQLTTCPYCHKQTTTQIKTEATSKTHLIAFIMSMLCCIPCCLIPYCVDSCKNRMHYCQHCDAYLGHYQ